MASNVAPAELANLEDRAVRLRRFYQSLARAGLAESYEAAHARLALDCIAAVYERRRLLAEGRLKVLPQPSQVAADKSYVATAIKLYDGLEAALASNKDSVPSRLRKIRKLWQAARAKESR